MVRQAIEEGFEVFASETGAAFGAVRHISRHDASEFVLYVENAGEFTVPITAVLAIHPQKVVVDVTKLDKALRRAIRHAHDAEDPDT